MALTRQHTERWEPADRGATGSNPSNTTAPSVTGSNTGNTTAPSVTGSNTGSTTAPSGSTGSNPSITPQHLVVHHSQHYMAPSGTGGTTDSNPSITPQHLVVQVAPQAATQVTPQLTLYGT